MFERNPQRGNRRSEEPDRLAEVQAAVAKNPALQLLMVEMLATPGEGPPPLRAPQFESIRKQAQEDWKVIEAKLIAALSPERAARMQKWNNSEDRSRSLLFATLQAVQQNQPRDFADFVADSDSVSDEELQAYLALPRDEMLSALRQDFSSAEFRNEEFGWLLGMGRGRGGRFGGRGFFNGPGGPGGPDDRGPGGPDDRGPRDRRPGFDGPGGPPPPPGEAPL